MICPNLGIIRWTGNTSCFCAAEYGEGGVDIPQSSMEAQTFQKSVLDQFAYFKRLIQNCECTFDELEQIEKVNLESEAYQNARDWLIISSYTGQRVSDFLNFTKKMIRKEKKITLIEFCH